MKQVMYTLFLIFSSSQLLALTGIDCKTSSPKDWMAHSEGLIRLDSRKITNTNTRLRRLEDGVLINAMITANYAALYRKEREMNGEYQWSAFAWLPAAAYASFEVGQAIRHGYLELKRKMGNSGTLTPPVYGEDPLMEVFPIGSFAVTHEQVALKLASGNQGVYKDLFWQHLSSIQCGIEETIRLLQGLQKTQLTSRQRENAILHEKGWRQVLQGMGRLERGLFLEGNMTLLWTEQKLILQPLVYDGFLGAIGGRIFAKIAVSPIKDPDFPNRSFRQFCQEEKVKPNFSHFPSRWEWLKEFMPAAYEYFNGPYVQRVKDDHEFFVTEGRRLVERAGERFFSFKAAAHF